MGEKGNLTGGVEQGKLPNVPKFGSTPASETNWPTGPGAQQPDWGKPTEATWEKGPGENWAKTPDGTQQIGLSVQPPPPPPPGVPPIGGFVAGGRHEEDDDDRQQPPPPPGGWYQPPQPPAPGR